MNEFKFTQSGNITAEKLDLAGFKDDEYGLNTMMSVCCTNVIKPKFINDSNHFMITSDDRGLLHSVCVDTFEQLADFINLINKHKL